MNDAGFHNEPHYKNVLVGGTQSYVVYTISNSVFILLCTYVNILHHRYDSRRYVVLPHVSINTDPCIVYHIINKSVQ